MPMSGVDAFSKGFGLTDNLMKQLLNQRELKQKADQFKSELEFKKAGQGRLAQAAADAHKLAQFNIAKAERENDPQKMMEYIQQWNNIKSGLARQNQANNVSSESMGEDTGMPIAPQESTGMPSPVTSNQGTSPPQGNTIDVGGTPMDFGVAQQLAAMGAPIPGLKDALKNFYEIQKASGTAEAKEHVKRQSELGDQFSSIQTGLEQIGRINQLMENYAKEAKDLGYSPHYGIGAELRTDPSALNRLMGRSLQRASHPLEMITHPLDAFEAVGAQAGSKVHEKYLSELRGELNNLVNAQAKNLNSRFTQKEYETLLQNKPSINDSEDVMRGKLKAISNAINDAGKKLTLQNAFLTKTRAGNEPFLSEKAISSSQLGRGTAGEYKSDIDKPFVDPKNPAYEYFEQNGKYYRRKRTSK